MAASLGGGSRTATLNLMLGIFLKLLGFFVVLYTYAEANPVKTQQAEESLRQRFSISVSLADLANDQRNASSPLVPDQGRSYNDLANKLKAQIDFLSSQYIARNDVLILTLPARTAMAVGGNPAESPEFIKMLVRTIVHQRTENYKYAAELIVSGEDQKNLMGEVSLLAQRMIAYDYPARLVTIGYKKDKGEPLLEIRLRQVRP